MLTEDDAMTNDDELIEAEQDSFLSAYAQGIYEEIHEKCGHCSISPSTGLSYELEFETVCDFSVTLLGSDTNNGDCVSAFLCIGGDLYMTSSDRCTPEEFRDRITELISSIAGNIITVRQVVKKHLSRETEFLVMQNGELKSVYTETKTKGLAAKLFLWKDRSDERSYDLNFK